MNKFWIIFLLISNVLFSQNLINDLKGDWENVRVNWWNFEKIGLTQTFGKERVMITPYVFSI